MISPSGSMTAGFQRSIACSATPIPRRFRRTASSRTSTPRAAAISPKRPRRGASAGGAIDLTEALLRKGATEIGASGHLDLDALHRPHGRIDASGAGLEPVLARYGVPSGALAIDGLLTGLIGSPVAPSAGAPQALRLPLRLENGRVFVGPVRTPLTLLPLY